MGVGRRAARGPGRRRAAHFDTISVVRSTCASGTEATTITTPLAIRQRPSASRRPKGSFMKAVAITPLKKTPTAPTGATSAVGAYPYARRLQHSPPIISRMPIHHSGILNTALIGLPSASAFRRCASFCRLSASGITKLAPTAIATPARLDHDICGPSCITREMFHEWGVQWISKPVGVMKHSGGTHVQFELVQLEPGASWSDRCNSRKSPGIAARYGEPPERSRGTPTPFAHG